MGSVENPAAVVCVHAQAFEVQEEKSDVSDNKVRIFLILFHFILLVCV